MELIKIEIFSRGKKHDEYGNPYYAYIAFLSYYRKSYFDKIIIYKSQSWGSCSYHDGLEWALQGINEALGLKQSPIKRNDYRIVYHHKFVSTYSELQNPLNWKIEHTEEIPCKQKIEWDKIKKEYPEAMILFRAGDFYEVMFDDAEPCCNAINITLTHRLTGLHKIPIAGFPCSALDSYLPKLIAKGYKIAIADSIL